MNEKPEHVFHRNDLIFIVLKWLLSIKALLKWGFTAIYRLKRELLLRLTRWCHSLRKKERVVMKDERRTGEGREWDGEKTGRAEERERRWCRCSVGVQLQLNSADLHCRHQKLMIDSGMMSSYLTVISREACRLSCITCSKSWWIFGQRWATLSRIPIQQFSPCHATLFHLFDALKTISCRSRWRHCIHTKPFKTITAVLSVISPWICPWQAISLFNNPTMKNNEWR